MSELCVLLVSDRPALVHFFTCLERDAGRPVVVCHLPVNADAVARHGQEVHRATIAALDACPDPVAAARVCEALRALRQALPVLTLLCCPDRLRPWEAEAPHAAGAHNLVGPHATPEEVIDALHGVARGEAVVNLRVSARGDSSLDLLLGRATRNGSAPLASLTPRDRDILELVALGLDNREIGQRLHLSPATVKHHVDRVRRDVGARDRPALLVWLYRNGFDPSPNGPAV